MATFLFELVSPSKLLFSGEVEEVVVPGMDGEFSVLADHAPTISTLRPGILVIKTGTETVRGFVRGGFAEVNEKGLTVLAEEAIPVEDIKPAEFAAFVAEYEAKVPQAASEEARFRMAETLVQLKAVQSQLAGGASAGH